MVALRLEFVEFVINSFQFIVEKVYEGIVGIWWDFPADIQTLQIALFLRHLPLS